MPRAGSFTTLSSSSRACRGCSATRPDDRLERAHFCSWWGVTMNRTYDNPAIEDLYRLHEMFHAAFMPYFPGIGFDAFHRKMEDNELKASVCSEIRVYFELPHLREIAFPHPIYADRFLSDPVDADAVAQEQAGRDRNAAGSAARRDVLQARARDGSDGALDPPLRAAEPSMVDLLVRSLRRDRAAHVRVSDPRLARRPIRRHRSSTPHGSRRGRSGWGRSHPLSPGGGAVREYLLEQPPALRSRIRDRDKS